MSAINAVGGFTVAAMVNCLISKSGGQHLHFVDGADGWLCTSGTTAKIKTCGVC